MDVRWAIQTLEQSVLYAIPIAQASVIVTLVVRKVIREFKIFALYLTVDILRSIIVGWWLGSSTPTLACRVAWMATEPVYLALQVLVVVEFYRLLYRAYPGIQAFARALLPVAVAVALGGTFGTLQLDIGGVESNVQDVRLFVAKRLVSSLLGFLMFTTMAFFPRAPSARHILWHGWLLTVLFLAAAGGFFGITYAVASQWAGAVFQMVQLGCFVLWPLRFRSPYTKAPLPSPQAKARTERWNQDFMILARWLVHRTGPLDKGLHNIHN